MFYVLYFVSASVRADFGAVHSANICGGDDCFQYEFGR